MTGFGSSGFTPVHDDNDSSFCPANYYVVMDLSELQSALLEAAKSLLDQFKNSSGFSMLGDSALAEASLVMQISAAFAHRQTAVWAESPFRSATDGNIINHLDLLIDLSNADQSQPDILLVEAKAGAPGRRSETIKEIVGDAARLRAWPRLDILSRPIFFHWCSIERVRGVIAVVFTEKLKLRDRFTFELKDGSLAGWWETTEGRLRASGTLPAQLKSQLTPAIWRKIVPGKVKDGGFQTFVAYAIFEYGVPVPNDLRKTAEHEAAHAVLALGFGLRVVEIKLCPSGDQKGQFACDWKEARGRIPDSELLMAASAVGYAGAVIDFRYRAGGEDFQDIMNRLPTDTKRLQEVREAAVEWGLAQDERAATSFTEAGYYRAVQLVLENWRLIGDLAEMLEEQDALDSDSLENWFDAARFACTINEDE